ncbi:MAG: formate dehydrogenase accessory sulfurtransferase FdhD [Chloroflexi bacterium]|nr:formate dehydrogenase accessory sulfurtransferase FdhD [Chloroflexota bacterium]
MFEDKVQTTYHHITEKGVAPIQGWVIGESRWTLFVNDSEVVTFMATARNLHHLALGFLASENFIARLDQVASLRVNLASDRAYWYIPALGIEETRAMAICEEGVGTIQVRLTHADFHLPARRIITSGCGGGVTFDDLSKEQTPMDSTRTVHVAQLFALMRELNARATLYRECRGVHTSALGDGEQLLALAEDVGRHNTLDKLRGECLLRGIATHDRILISTGRISSEMITKAAKMRVPIVVSRTSPTHLSVQLARAWNVTLIGYLHAGQMQVYHGMERIIVD